MAGFAPQILGRYVIHGEIASGGMASVHFARLMGPSGFARTVAIKRAHPHLAKDPDFALMFLDEARLASRIRHANVVSTIDILQTPDDLVLVMDYVHGESLWRLVQAGSPRVPLPIAAAILIDTLHGLHAAHEATDEQGGPLGIVHRDVSPQNMLVGVDGITRLVDFGIAKAAGRLHSTRDSAVKGKYAYMAPEQVRGEEVSRLTDTYAAAIVFWELLTGERLFVGKSDAETIHKCLVARVRPPSMFVPELPSQIDAILRKGLSREPGQRYATAREMALDIEACVPAIRPSEVGAWVERVAGAALAERAQVLADIERTDPGEAPTVSQIAVPGAAGSSTQPNLEPTRLEPRMEVSEAGAPGLARGSRPDADPLSTRASAASVLSGVAFPRERSRARAVTAALLALLVGVAVVWGLFGRRGAPAVEPVSASSAVASSAPAPRAPVSVAPPPPAPVVASAPAPASAPPRPSSRSAGPRRPKRGAGCDPPYSIDAQGREIFKPECM